MEFSREKLIASGAVQSDSVETEFGTIKVAQPAHGPMRRYIDMQGKEPPSDNDARLLQLACVTEQGQPLFGSMDAAKRAVDNLSTESILAIQKVAMRLYNSAKLKQQVKELAEPAGNSEASPSESSPSTSA